jgi:hypothetical protein
MESTRGRMGYCEIPPKNLHYFPNGTGRDSYIATTSGGLFAARTPRLPPEIGKQLSHLQAPFPVCSPIGRRVRGWRPKESTTTPMEQAVIHT